MPSGSRRWTRRDGVAAALLATAAWAFIQPWTVMVVLLLLVIALTGIWGLRRHPTLRLRRRIGVDGFLDLHQYRTAAGRRGARGGTSVGRLVSGTALLFGRRVYTPHRRGVLVVGPQGAGKSSLLVDPIRHFPGPAYVTSTKTELADLTAATRALAGPVHVFNPTGLGGVASTLRWDPVAGCRDPAVADARARALVRGGGGATGTQNADFWAAKASEILRCYLLTAALTGQTMSAVMSWALHPDDTTPASTLAQWGPHVPAGWLGTLQQNLSAAPNTRSGYFAALGPAVAFMDNPTVAACCRPGPDESFDIAGFLRDNGTVYVVAGDSDQRLAPLLTAFTEAVFATAKQVAAARPGGHLDPPLGLFLDEIANITPVPLDNWAADSRGWGIEVWAVVQDLAQLETRWGASRAKTIFANLPTKIVLPGVVSRTDLEHLAFLAGTRTITQTSRGRSDSGDGRTSRSSNTSTALEPVINGPTIHALPRWHAYVLGLGPKPAIIRFRPGWRGGRQTPLDQVLAHAGLGSIQTTPGPALTSVPEAVEDAA
ncbi:type IV secretory system conjugative DNA transfer family protein [Pseudonocardia sp. WMMC193]|uniref:type IV secretory system conjugative DNA transfer family protein n=1 Tax=Pseudonocardia sp. WMMC193 TaxID=2911965 RepID=UPI001F238052|nr:TraM recognition domain-containing protein [Pseudonocardia sp. WMMC193]MCF7547290.1 TraM recognition domain-containing protein [Pseudonocardia sp. WMMC193]MCF7547385.1 TraM recognition domain-containing protein [Pseudonocardia sp. WMMC193]